MTSIKGQWTFKRGGTEGFFQRFPNQASKVFKGLLEKEGRGIMSRSQKIVPFKSGALRSSGIVTTRVQNNRIEVTMAYGGGAVNYAVIVHEDLQTHRSTGSAKYLEIPFRERVTGMSRRISGDMKRKLRF